MPPRDRANLVNERKAREQAAAKCERLEKDAVQAAAKADR